MCAHVDGRSRLDDISMKCDDDPRNYLIYNINQLGKKNTIISFRLAPSYPNESRCLKSI